MGVELVADDSPLFKAAHEQAISNPASLPFSAAPSSIPVSVHQAHQTGFLYRNPRGLLSLTKRWRVNDKAFVPQGKTCSTLSSVFVKATVAAWEI